MELATLLSTETLNINTSLYKLLMKRNCSSLFALENHYDLFNHIKSIQFKKSRLNLGVTIVDIYKSSYLRAVAFWEIRDNKSIGGR